MDHCGIILIASVAPGDSFALVEVRDKKGNIGLAAATMALLCFTMPFTAPLWLSLFSNWFPIHLSVSGNRIFLTIAPITILPLIMGVLFHDFLPAAASFLGRILEKFFHISLVLISAASLYVGAGALFIFTLPSVVCIFSVVSLALVIGYYAGGTERKDRITLGLTASLGNLAVVMLIAQTSYPNVSVLAVAVVFVMLRWLTLMAWYIFLRFRLHLRGQTLF